MGNKVKTVQSAPKAPPSDLARALVQRSAKRQDGHTVPVQHRSIDRNGVATFGVDFSSAPVPIRRYPADFADIVVKRGNALMIFAQESVTGEIESALQIRMSRNAVADMVRVFEDDGKMNGQLAASIRTAEPEELTTVSQKPHQEAKVVANFAAVAVAGLETCIDFYHASAFALAATMGQNEELTVEPIVRVDMNTALFAPWLERLREVSARLAKGPSGESDEQHAAI